MRSVNQIQKATLEDATRIAELVNSAYRGEGAKKGWTTESDIIDGSRTAPGLVSEAIQRKDTTILKYEVDNSILACVELIVEKPKVHLQMLTVHPTLQGKGVGKILLAAAEDFARTERCTAINMSVITTRHELIDWYTRHGYQDTGKRKPFAFSDPRLGQPRQPLEFMILEKQISQ